MSVNNDIDNNIIIDMNNLDNESISENNQYNNENINLINDNSDMNYVNIINEYSLIKSKYKQTETEINKILEKIDKNNIKIEEIKNNLSK